MGNITENSLNDLLNKMKGKEVILYLHSGATLGGKLGEAADYASANARTVHLQEIVGQDFYDAVIAKDAVAAVLYRR